MRFRLLVTRHGHDLEFRETLSGVPTPVSVVTAYARARPFGTTVGSFCSLSLEPPMVMIALDRLSKTLDAIRESRRFGVNILSAEQAGPARAFATKESDKFGEIRWHVESGLPRLAEATGWLVCDLDKAYPGGDHIIVTGLVRHCEITEASPLIYHRRRFCALRDSETR
jgi:flavin reductase (DIM6/NTAB) family NADH-FMN oxidoreductase RutF